MENTRALRTKRLILTGAYFALTPLLLAEPWTHWSKDSQNPVYTHSLNVASDPTAIKDGGLYRMVVSGDGGAFGASPDGNNLIMATSPDGRVWSTLANGQNGVVVPSGAPGDWDESLETPEIVRRGAEYLLFYAGYDPAVRDASTGLAWGDLGLAISTDGAAFARWGAPVLTRGAAPAFDQDGITDPTIVETNGVLSMIYTGWCTQGCTLNSGQPALYILKATSTDGGRTWSKLGQVDPVFTIGLHADLVRDNDGLYSLFYGEDGACSLNRIGILQARSVNPLGPFTVSTAPVLCMGTQGFENDGLDGGFPDVMNDGGVGRMYYTGVEVLTFTYQVGMALALGNPAPAAGPEPRGYPNPLNPTAGTMSLQGLTPNHIARIYTPGGRLVRELFADGAGAAEWDGKNAAGEIVASGVYLIRSGGGGGSKTFKIVVQY